MNIHENIEFEIFTFINTKNFTLENILHLAEFALSLPDTLAFLAFFKLKIIQSTEKIQWKVSILNLLTIKCKLEVYFRKFYEKK